MFRHRQTIGKFEENGNGSDNGLITPEMKSGLFA